MVERRDGQHVEELSPREKAAERAQKFELRSQAIFSALDGVKNRDPEHYPEDDSLDPDMYQSSDLKNAIAGVRTFIREFPREAFLDLEKFPVWLRHHVESEAIGELAVEDEEEAFRFYKENTDVSNWTDQHTPEENMATALEWMAGYIAPRMLLEDSEKGLDFLKRRVVSADLVEELGEDVAVAREAYSRRYKLLDKDPVRALDIITKAKEMAGDHNDDVLVRDEQGFLETASEKFLDVDPETALQLHERFLESKYERVDFRKQFRDFFAVRVEIGRARKLVRDGDVVVAFGLSKNIETGDRHKAGEEKRFLIKEIEEKVGELMSEYEADDADDYDKEITKGNEYTRAKEYIKSLPDDIPGFSKVSLRLGQSLNREAGSRTRERYGELHPNVPKGMYDQVEFAKLETAIRDELRSDVSEIGWVNDNGVREKTPEEILSYVRAMMPRAELRTGLLKKVELSKLPDDDEFRSSPEYDEIRRVVFGVQKQERKHILDFAPGNSEVKIFHNNFPGFGDLAEELEPDEREKIVAEVISQDHYAAIFATETGLKLTEAEQSKVLEKIGKDPLPFDLFFRADFRFYESEGVDKDEFQKKLLLLNPEKFFSAFLANNGKEGSLELAESVSSLMMKTMIEVNPVKLIVFAEKVEDFEKNFSDESVQIGYASTYKKLSDQQKSNLERIREYTQVDPDWVSIGKILLRDNPTLLDLEGYVGADDRLAEHMPWAGALKKLEVMQGHTANEEHDPWKTDLEPLVRSLKQDGLLSYESAEDGELLVKFVSEYGMINARNLAEIFIGLSRGEGLADLPVEHQKILVEAVGIDHHLPSHKLLKRAFSRATKSGKVWKGGLSGVPEKAMDLIAPRETDGVKVGEEQFAPRGKVDFADLGEDDQDFVKEAYQFARADQLTSAQLLHELKEVRRSSIEGFLKDEVPPHLKTELGQEIFAAATGGGQFVATGQLGYVIGVWEKTRSEKPELAKLPEGYQEEVIEVPIRSRRKMSGDEVEKSNKEKGQILEKKAVKEQMFKYNQALEEHGDRDHEDEIAKDVFYRFKKSLQNNIVSLEERRAGLHGQALEAVESRLRAIRDMDDYYTKITLSDFYRTHSTGLGARESQMTMRINSPIRAMEQLVAGGAKGPEFDALLLRLSVIHVNDTIRMAAAAAVDYEDRELVNDHEYLPNGHFVDSGLFRYEDDPELPDEEFVFKMSEFIEQYISEHYLHPEQEDHHTGHPKFSPELLRVLGGVWGVTKGVEKNPIVAAKRALDQINNPTDVSVKTMAVAMVPGQGLPRIMSGDTGDACTSSRHGELARGEYPGVKAFTYVLGRGTPQERFAGSTLFVESKVRGKEDSVLVVRANNPRENLIQSVDNVSFTLQSLDKAIETAQRRVIDEVLVPLDSVTQSSSNRSGVSDVYTKLFSKNPKRALENTPDTNFNNYDIWNSDGRHPCVVVWTKKDGKINWPKPKPEAETDK